MDVDQFSVLTCGIRMVRMGGLDSPEDAAIGRVGKERAFMVPTDFILSNGCWSLTIRRNRCGD